MYRLPLQGRHHYKNFNEKIFMKNKEQLFLIILIVAVALLTLVALNERRDPLILHGVKARYVAIPSTGRDINNPSSYFFGKAPFFIVFDRTKKTYRAVPNKYANAPHAAGLKASQMLVDMDVDAVCANNIGFEQTRILHRANIEMYANIKRTPRETLEAFPGGLIRIDEQSVQSRGSVTDSADSPAYSRFDVYANTAEIMQGKYFVCYRCGYHLRDADMPAAAGRQNICPYCGGGLHEVTAVSTLKTRGLKPKIKVF